MKIEINDKENNQKEIFFSLSPSDMEPYLRLVAKQRGAKMNLKGFRKGEAPYEILEKSLGKDLLWNESSIDAVDASYRKALEDNNIQPVGRPKIDIKKNVPGNDFEFVALVPLKPDFKLPDYNSISKEVLKNHKDSEIEIHEHEIDETLNSIFAKREKVEGKTEIDDDFARSLGAFKNLDQLKESIRDGIKQEKEQKQKEALRLKVIEKIREKTGIAISDVLIDNELTAMRDDLENYVSSSGISFDDYLKKANQTEEDLKNNWKEKAKARVEVSFIIDAIADEEKIEPTEKEVEEHANKYLSQFETQEQAINSMSPEALKAQIRNIIRSDKVLKMLEGKEEVINSNKK